MSIIDEIINEVDRLKDVERQYKYLIKDKEFMSERLYELSMYKYNNTPYDQRLAEHREMTCSVCRYRLDCHIVLPEDIRKPAKSEKAWLPPFKTCEEFEWA